MSKLTNDTIRVAREMLWRKHDVSWKLDANQKVCYDIFYKSKEKINVWSLARGSGKSFLLCVIAIETALKNGNSIIKYCCPRQKDAVSIIRPLFRDILEDCPADLKPRWIKGEGAYVFPNGSRLEVSGLDTGRVDSLRGGSVKLAIVDEAGDKRLDHPEYGLNYIVTSILIPCVTRTKDINGKLILASTPPLKIDHPFVTYIRKAEYAGTLVVRDIYSNPRMTPEMIQDLIVNCGGINSDTFKREYLCQLSHSSSASVIPEFTPDLEKVIVKEWQKPPFYDAYVSMDLGFRDLTAVVFAYYDFRNGVVVIEDEIAMNGPTMTTKALAEAIIKKERELYTDPATGEFKAPHKRVSDNNLIVINDLARLHDLHFRPTDKDDKEAAVNNLRMLIAANKLIIHPRCKNTIRHLRDASWDSERRKFAHSKVDGSHWDFADSCIYLARNIDFYKNPYPAHYGNPSRESYFSRSKTLTPLDSAFSQMTNIGRLDKLRRK